MTKERRCCVCNEYRDTKDGKKSTGGLFICESCVDLGYYYKCSNCGNIHTKKRNMAMKGICLKCFQDEHFYDEVIGFRIDNGIKR